MEQVTKTQGRLDSQIFAWFVGLLVLIQVTTVWLAYTASRESVEQQIRNRLGAAQQFFYSEFDSRSQYLTGFVTTVAKDWGFRQAVGRADELTINSMILNSSLRLGADVGFFIDADGNLRGSTLNLDGGALRDIERVIEQAELSDSAGEYQDFFIRIENKVYQFVLASMEAPIHIGWIAMGFSVDNELASQFHNATGLQTTFIGVQNSMSRIYGSTLTAAQIESYGVRRTLNRYLFSRQEVDGAANDSAWLGSDQSMLRMIVKKVFPDRSPMTTADNSGSKAMGDSTVSRYLVDQQVEGMQLSIPIDTGSDLELSVLLHQSITEQLNGFNRWWNDLLLLFSLTLLLGAMAVILIARRITSPLRKLVDIMRQITSGNYQQEFELTQKNEIGALAQEFQSMQGAVAMREKEIRYRAEHDVLTGMQNRDKFLANCQHRIDQLYSVSSSQSFAILIFDVDCFGNVNEALGHAAGDQLLADIGRRIGETFEHDLLARISADQFAVALVYDVNSQMLDAVHRLQERFNEPFTQSGIDIVLGVTAGIACYPEHGREAIQLLRSADVAMTSAKKRRLDHIVYSPMLDCDSVKRLALMSELPTAIDSDQLVLFYQPTLTLSADGRHRVSKVECLVRWQHPSYGFIPPDEFISLAEQTGIITRLTYWVIKTAMQQFQLWRDNGIELDFAVNISAVDLFKGNLQALIPALLAHFDIAPNKMVLEVTEGEVMQDPEKAIAILTELSAAGIRISIDDYGTGYSSLAYLKQLPVDELKIDKSFVMNVTENSDDEIIVRSTIDMARTMGMAIVAEGVESAAALDFLNQRGCHYAQGFYISKPLPAAELEQWLLQTDYLVGEGRRAA